MKITSKEARFYIVKTVIKERVIKSSKGKMLCTAEIHVKKRKELKEMSYTCKKSRKVFDRNANIIRNQGTKPVAYPRGFQCWYTSLDAEIMCPN